MLHDPIRMTAPVTAPLFAAQLNEQIGNEFAAHQQYIACAIHYDALTMPQMAAFFYGQALEEREHAMMMVQFLLDTDCEVKIPGVEAPTTAFENIVAPVELALAQEKRVSEQIAAEEVPVLDMLYASGWQALLFAGAGPGATVRAEDPTHLNDAEALREAVAPAFPMFRDAERVSRTIVVPGNHDVRWWHAPLGIGNQEKLYEAYRTYIAGDLEPVLRLPGATLVGLNTCHGITRKTLTWNLRDLSIIGYLTKSQIERARREFAKSPAADVRVIVMHHNPLKGELSQRHGLKNTRRVLGAFADLAVDAVLCGHDHQEAIHYVEHTKRGTVVSTAGTVSSRSRGGRPSSLNVLDVDQAQIKVTTHVWSPAEKAFLPGAVKCFTR